MEKDIFLQNLALVADLKPKALWEHFVTLCVTPRGSNNEAEIAQVIVDLALERNLLVVKDYANNVLVYLHASPGLEHLPWICLQAHIDMVCEKNKDVESVFPIELMLKEGGNKVTGNGTTLGADNGVAVAAMMTLISCPDIPHGRLELFFTTAEEVGMEGAAKFDYSHIRSKRFLNLDSEEEGIVYVGCAGGGRVTGKFPVTFEDAPKNGTKLKIELSGFLGGHSGVDIGLGRANAAKVLPLVLSDLQDLDFKIRLIDFSGGAKMNAIPREATAIIMIPTDDLAWFSKAIDDVSGKIFSAYPSEEPNLSYSEIALEGTEKVFDEESQKAFFALMFGLPHGVSSMEFEDETMVQTSNNIGIVKMDGYEIEITSMYRSSRESEIDRIAKVIEDVFHNAGAKVEAGNRYSPWEPQFDTVLLNLVKSKFEELFGYKPKVKTIHAGLECAEFYKRIPGVEITSFGPTMGDVHTPNEWLDIESVGRFWVLLQSLLLAE